MQAANHNDYHLYDQTDSCASFEHLKRVLRMQTLSVNHNSGLISRLFAILFTLVLMGCMTVAMATDARQEVELVSPPMPPNVEEWAYFDSASGCGMPIGSEDQEAAIIGCLITQYQNTHTVCSSISYSHAGEWFDDAGNGLMGYSRDERRDYTVQTQYPEYDHSVSPPVLIGCEDNEPSGYHIRRRRAVDCTPYYLYSPGATMCESTATEKLLGTPPIENACALEGNPCNAATGDKYETAVDYSGPGFSFQRTYHSQMPRGDAGLGIGWTHDYSAKLVLTGSPAVPNTLVTAAGFAIPLEESAAGSGIYLSITGSGTQIVAGTGGEWVHHTNAGGQEYFSATGQLLRMASPAGQITTLQYGTQGELEKVIGPFGHELQFFYGGEDYLEYIDFITDPAGNVIQYDYDADRNLEQVTYQDNTFRTYLYTKPGFPHLLTGIQDENGVQYATFDYDSSGRAILSEHSGGIGRIDLNYDAANDLTTVTDADSNVTTYTFTPGNDEWVWTIAGSSNPYTSLEQAVQAARDSDPQYWNLVIGRFDRYLPPSGADEDYRKLLSIELDGDTRLFNYDPNDYARRLETLTDENGNVTRYGYDQYHRTSMTEADQDTSGQFKRTTSYSNFLEDSSELPQLVTSPSVAGGGAVRSVATTYHPGTRLPQTVTIAGYAPSGAGTWRTTTFETYNSDGQVTRINGPRTDLPAGQDDVVDIDYYDTDALGAACSAGGGGRCGQLKTITNALGHVTTFNEYYADGRLKKITDPNGLVTDYTYELRGWVNTITVTDGSEVRVTDYDYDAAGRIDLVTLPNGVVLDYAWTDAHLLDSITDNNGDKIDYSYDLRGNRTGEDLKAPNGTIKKAVTMAYDARNRLESLQQGNSVAASLNFDAVGNLEDATDPNSHFTDYAYDALNRLTTVIDPVNGMPDPTDYGYDVHDNLTSVTAPNDANTTYVYDDLGNLLEENSPDRGKTLYAYDAAGNMTCKADGRYTAGATYCAAVTGRWVYTYDALNRVATIDYTATTAVPDVTFDYDAAGELGRLDMVSYEDAAGTIVDTQYDYNLFGNVTDQRQYVPGSPVAPSAYATGYTYEKNDALQTITYPSGRVVEYVRNTTGEIFQIKMTSPIDQAVTTLVSGVLYEPFGPAKNIFLGNGLASFRTHDTAYRPDQIGLGNINGAWDYHGYSYDEAGNIEVDTDALDASNSRDYDYDQLHRLTDDTRVDANAGLATYTYDGNGNRTARHADQPGFASQTLLYDTANNQPNRIATFNGQPVTYDGAGNLTNNGAGVTSTYNAASRLASINSAGSTVTMLYNGLGELARTDTSPSCPCGGCATWQEYFHFASDGRALGMVQQSSSNITIEWDWIWLDNIPVAQIQESYDSQGVHVGTEITYLHTDQLGTPRVGTSPAGAITWRNASDAFGKAILSGTATVRLRFPGQIDYGLAGVYYNYFRDYDSNTGRYLESDPIGLEGGLNTYGYVGANPLTNIDPLGLIKDSVESAIESAVVRGDVKALRTLSEIVTDPRKRKLLEEGIKKLTTRADDFIAQNCKASVNRQFPGQFRDKTLEQIFEAARSGDRAARTAKKLLTDSRFLK